MLSFFILIAACSANTANSSETATPTTTATVYVAPTQYTLRATMTPTPTITPTPTDIPVIPTNTPVPSPTPSLTFNDFESIGHLYSDMRDYGQINEYQLSYDYWLEVDRRIAMYGEAKRLLVMEYHGDSYSMFEDKYALTPESFVSQMTYLLENEYHFVTVLELQGFVEGWLKLPARSVVLTTDSGSTSQVSIPRMITAFQKLESIYGSRPQMISFIWTYNMDKDEADNCAEDACWQTFLTAKNSGYFTFGSHTESHQDFSTFTTSQTMYDLKANRLEIQKNLGLTVFAIAWPFEACSPYTDLLAENGWTLAFGGYSRLMSQLYTYVNDPLSLCLPRLFPPNPDGISSRPAGLTLPQMLEEMQKDVPLK